MSGLSSWMAVLCANSLRSGLRSRSGLESKDVDEVDNVDVEDIRASGTKRIPIGSSSSSAVSGVGGGVSGAT